MPGFAWVVSTYLTNDSDWRTHINERLTYTWGNVVSTRVYTAPFRGKRGIHVSRYRLAEKQIQAISRPRFGDSGCSVSGIPAVNGYLLPKPRYPKLQVPSTGSG